MMHLLRWRKAISPSLAAWMTWQNWLETRREGGSRQPGGQGRDRESGSACGGSEGVGTSVISFVAIPARQGMTIYGITVRQHIMPNGSHGSGEIEIHGSYHPGLLIGRNYAISNVDTIPTSE